MANRIRTGDPHGFNKGCSSKFRRGYRVQQTPEGRRTYQPKHCGNNKDEDNSPKNLNNKNQASLQKFSQLKNWGAANCHPFINRFWYDQPEAKISNLKRSWKMVLIALNIKFCFQESRSSPVKAFVISIP